MRGRASLVFVGLASLAFVGSTLGCRVQASVGPADDETPPSTPPSTPPDVPAVPPPPTPPAQTFTLANATIEWLDADDTHAYYLTTSKDLYRVALDKNQTPEKIGSSPNGLQMGL